MFCFNKFEKLVHRNGFIIRIYHDAARSLECKILLAWISTADPWSVQNY